MVIGKQHCVSSASPVMMFCRETVCRRSEIQVFFNANVKTNALKKKRFFSLKKLFNNGVIKIENLFKT